MRTWSWHKGMLAGLLVLTAVWLGSLIWGLSDKAQVAITEAEETKAQYRELEARKEALEADLDILATPRGQDAAIREAFGVAKVGEEVIVVVPAPPATTTQERSWWEAVVDWF